MPDPSGRFQGICIAAVIVVVTRARPIGGPEPTGAPTSPGKDMRPEEIAVPLGFMFAVLPSVWRRHSRQHTPSPPACPRS